MHMNGIYIYNNTVHGWQGGSAGIDFGVGHATSNAKVYNNIWKDCVGVALTDQDDIADMQNNQINGATLFVSTNTYDFRLASANGAYVDSTGGFGGITMTMTGVNPLTAIVNTTSGTGLLLNIPANYTGSAVFVRNLGSSTPSAWNFFDLRSDTTTQKFVLRGDGFMVFGPATLNWPAIKVESSTNNVGLSIRNGADTAYGAMTAGSYATATNAWALDTTLPWGTNALVLTSGATTGGIIGISGFPTSVNGSLQLNITATGDIVFTNLASFSTSDFLSSRTITNGNKCVIGVNYVPDVMTNLAIVQFR